MMSWPGNYRKWEIYVNIFAGKFQRKKTNAREFLGCYVGWRRELQFINYLEFAYNLFYCNSSFSTPESPLKKLNR
jgi:hypothetical protein